MTIYTEHFGLTERPFTLLPDPDFLFWSEEHSRAYAMLEYGMLTHAPITVITGEIGAGKTTLIRYLLRNLPEEFTVGLVSNAQGNRGELLHWVLMALGVQADMNASYVQLFAQFQDFLIEEYAAGRRTMLIFDEAQNLSLETLEELRMFSNINADKDELLQLVLVGQPELRDLIAQPRLVQFAQRVAAEYHLPGLSAEAVRACIEHRGLRMRASRLARDPAARQPDLRLRDGLCLHRRAGEGRCGGDRAGDQRPGRPRRRADGGMRDGMRERATVHATGCVRGRTGARADG